MACLIRVWKWGDLRTLQLLGMSMGAIWTLGHLGPHARAWHNLYECNQCFVQINISVLDNHLHAREWQYLSYRVQKEKLQRAEMLYIVREWFWVSTSLLGERGGQALEMWKETGNITGGLDAKGGMSNNKFPWRQRSTMSTLSCFPGWNEPLLLFPYTLVKLLSVPALCRWCCGELKWKGKEM